MIEVPFTLYGDFHYNIIPVDIHIIIYLPLWFTWKNDLHYNLFLLRLCCDVIMLQLIFML